MATRSTSFTSQPSSLFYAITIKYAAKCKPFHFTGRDLVSNVVKKAASDLGVSFEERAKLILVHLGSQLPNDSTLEEALKDSTSTCCFLQLSARDVRSSLTISDINNRERAGKCLGYCVECMMVVQTRPEYTCSLCRGQNFVLNCAVNIFEDEHATMSGHCDDCKKEVKPTITHYCAANITLSSDSHHAVFLPHLRQNVINLPCMKCEKKERELIKFHCNHTMCRYCFVNMCRMMFELEGFVSHPDIGYSIGCPGGGNGCSHCLITDPHHFYLVEGRKGFYEKYQAKAFHEYVEEQKVPKCHKCQCRLDMSQGQEEEVVTPSCLIQENISAEPGGVWFSFIKLFKKRQSRVVTNEVIKKTRQQVKCTGCLSMYCGECTLIWHEGECIKLSTEQQADANRFKVDLKKAAASEWRR